MSQTKLLPCPFCGEPAEMDTYQNYRNISTGNMETGVAIYCVGCGVQAMLCRGDIPDLEPEMVVEIWNRRALSAPSPVEGGGDERVKPAPNPEWEAIADAAHAEIRAEAGEPEIAQTLTMLKAWKAPAEPADEQGRITFSRALLDSATDALEAAIAQIPTSPPQATNSEVERLTRAAKALLNNIDEFGTITDGEFLEDLRVALAQQGEKT